MRRQIVATVAALVAAHVAAPQACGDKYLVNSRGTRFERAGFVRPPARVLVFAPASEPAGQLVVAADLERALTKVGYRPTLVGTREALAVALGGHAWDVLVVDLADREALRATGGASAAVVALAFTATGDEVKRARREVAAVVRRPKRSAPVVEAIDGVLYHRSLSRSSARAGA